MNIVVRILAVAAMLGASAMSASAERLAAATETIAFDISAKKKGLKNTSKKFDDAVRDNQVTSNEFQSMNSMKRSGSSSGRAPAGSSSSGMKKR
jgi:hypothetical protein